MPDDHRDSEPPEDRVQGAPDNADEFDNLVLDESFVKGGAYEPPARTRLAIARYGGQQTSWRHGGAASGSRSERGQRVDIDARELRRRAGPSLSPTMRARLPIIVTIVVVVVAALLMFR